MMSHKQFYLWALKNKEELLKQLGLEEKRPTKIWFEKPAIKIEEIRGSNWSDTKAIIVGYWDLQIFQKNIKTIDMNEHGRAVHTEKWEHVASIEYKSSLNEYNKDFTIHLRNLKNKQYANETRNYSVSLDILENRENVYLVTCDKEFEEVKPILDNEKIKLIILKTE